MSMKKDEGRVPLTTDVMMKCICGTCPVQAESACSRPKIENMTKMKTRMMESKEAGVRGMSTSLVQGPMGEMKPNAEDMPGVYCSIGVAACKDLDAGKACICWQCEVYKDYMLKEGRPVEHFCFNSKSI